MHAGLDYATFHVPHALLAPADRERRQRVPKEDRQYWSDKNDFCRLRCRAETRLCWGDEDVCGGSVRMGGCVRVVC